jgi:hypothetical protein
LNKEYNLMNSRGNRYHLNQQAGHLASKIVSAFKIEKVRRIASKISSIYLKEIIGERLKT